MKIAGNKIREARTNKGMSIEDLHLRTRIDTAILKSIGNGDDPGLPAVNLKGFLRSIAVELDLDPDSLIKSAGLEILGLNKIDTDFSADGEKSVGFLKFITNSSVIGLSAVIVLFTLVYLKYLKHDFAESGSFSLLSAVPDSAGVESTFSEVLADSVLFRNRVKKVIPVNNNNNFSALAARMEIKDDFLHIRGTAGTELYGSVTKEEIESVVKNFKSLIQNAKQDPGFIQALEQVNPRMNIVAFFGSWNQTSLQTAAKLISIIDEAYVPGVSLSLVGVDENIHDSAGLAELHNVTAVASVIFLSRGTELGRIVFHNKEYNPKLVEDKFSQIAKKAEIYIKAGTDE